MAMPKSSMLWFAVLFLSAQTFVVSAQANDEPENDNTGIKINALLSVDGSGAYYTQQSDFKGGFDTWVNVRASGDLGSRVSYFFDIGVAALYAKREYLGLYQVNVDKPDTVKVYSEPQGYFPYSYRSSWGGFIFPLDNLQAGGPTGWPDFLSVGFNVFCEIAGSAFNDTLRWRAGRTEREIAGMVEGGSIVLNKSAQPFFGFDLEYAPFTWLNFYSISGVLEYFDTDGITVSSRDFQNVFSLSMVTLRYKNYLHIDVGSSVVWPKRFELGYLFPLMPALLYQNNIGDFDNIGLFGNIKLQKPGLGFLWFSLFIDEMNLERKFFKLDREMYAFQAGLRYVVPVLPVSSFTMSYTKIEPYCYTHPRVKVPWYDAPVTQAYTNHGYGLGYYLPPNSDEIKLAFTAMPWQRTAVDALFQMIRHGADYGAYAVDGSSYYSELSEDDRSDNPKLEKYFLKDGAYQYQIVFNWGITHTMKNFPLEFSFRTGTAFSFWTFEEHLINTTEYPERTAIIAQIGVKLFY